jgi:hypothetical protein
MRKIKIKIKSRPRTSTIGAELDALVNETAERERMFARGLITIFEAIYGEVNPRRRAELIDRVECLLMQADTDAPRDLMQR